MKINEITKGKYEEHEPDSEYYGEIRSIIELTGKQFGNEFEWEEEEEDFSQGTWSFSASNKDGTGEGGWWNFGTYAGAIEGRKYVGIYVGDASSGTKGLTTAMFKNILDFLESKYGNDGKRVLTIAGGSSGQLNKAVDGWAKVANRINAEYETSQGY